MNDTQQELREKLAAIEHERWADWQRWVHGSGVWGTVNGVLCYCIDGKQIMAWGRQIDTPYSELSDQEKASDMGQVDRYWPLIEQLITANRTALLDAVEGVLPERRELEGITGSVGERVVAKAKVLGYNEARYDVRTALATLRGQNCGLDGSGEPATADSNQVDDRGEFREGSL